MRAAQLPVDGTAPGETALPTEPLARFRVEYARQRAAEGRTLPPADLRALPYLATGPLARAWAVRARTYDAFVRRVLVPLARAAHRPLRILDLGAGDGWVSRRAALAGHAACAVDLRVDDVDGLRAADRADDGPPPFRRLAASYEALPLRAAQFDIAVFNASLHYALDLGRALAEAGRAVRSGGFVAILDSPFYATEAAGCAMVAEKRRLAGDLFGERAAVLMAPPFVEFLTRARLRAASRGLGLEWRRHRVRYPLWYELRPVVARLRRRRPPSRFDLWLAHVP